MQFGKPELFAKRHAHAVAPIAVGNAAPDGRDADMALPPVMAE
jgi:hypothetical protein